MSQSVGRSTEHDQRLSQHQWLEDVNCSIVEAYEREQEVARQANKIQEVVFHPHYPNPLRKKRDVLASGVAAAFSVKRTLNREEIAEAYKQAAMIRQGMKIREGTPRDHLALACSR